VTTQVVAVPVQPPPDQPEKVEPLLGIAVSVIIAPWGKSSLQSLPQLMPTGDEVTLPAPPPERVTVRVCKTGEKLAVTVVSAASVTTQVPMPVQPPPDQPAKIEPPVGAAVSVTLWPASNCAAQLAPQVMPAGFDVTEPEPRPVLAAVRV
jgi:hypothetical protein